ncbi:hypothetical protein L249_5933 [Ophiocordyceps polyrhachis-furcata BCC 54312]|uniref:Sialidase n=1 Tax=Ophiocordyceps polyrhachis-furcata BCC 54312 TaxID=1330021 RepID=A0A367LIR5_9HYPO|nr:hypothetical protein L249_5933 [Ophiocordyceps polyrhachis-furcata BCC 54312]
MSDLEANVGFDLTLTTPSTPPPRHLQRGLALDDPFWLHVPCLARRHSRSSSQDSSVYSAASTVDSTPDSAYSRLSTPPPPRADPPVRHHGPLLLPKIRLQDQHFDAAAPLFPWPHSSIGEQHPFLSPAPVLYPSASFSMPEACHTSIDYGLDLESNRCLPYDPMSTLVESSSDAVVTSSLSDVIPSCGSEYLSSHVPRALYSVSTTTLLNYLTSPNPAATLVRTISLPLRDPGIKHFWWDVRNISSWDSFGVRGVSALLSTPLPASALPQPTMTSRHPETEASLHALYASYYLPKLNAALAVSSDRPLRLYVPTAKTSRGTSDLVFVANGLSEPDGVAALFGGKASARLVGLIRSFDRFNTGMRTEGNIKRVEYLAGLAALHHAMREHGCRYGFILTEIELVLVRCGSEPTPYFGDLDMTSVPLAVSGGGPQKPLTACLALWILCQLAGDVAPEGHAHWRAEIGAPAEGTRRKAKPREAWMPQPQLAEKREAKRSRGWVWPEDAVGRRELGRRGVRYGGV